MSTMVGRAGCRQSQPHRDSFPALSSPWRVTVVTALLWLMVSLELILKVGLVLRIGLSCVPYYVISSDRKMERLLRAQVCCSVGCRGNCISLW